MAITCKICFENASGQGTSQARITPCGHVFCQPCATTWFRSDASCPVCRNRVNGLSALIPLYDQDAGLQSSLFDECPVPLDDVISPKRNGGYSDNISATRNGGGFSDDFSMSSLKTGIDNGNLQDVSKSSMEGETTTHKRAGDDEDVQVRFVLGKVAERWQQVMVERAKLKMQVASLDKTKHELLAKVQKLTEENNALREALTSRSWPSSRRKSNQCSILDDANDNWETKITSDSIPSGCKNADMEQRILHRDCYLDPCREIGSIKAAAKGPERVLERLQANKWELVHTFAMHSGPVHGIAVNPSGNLVATASWDTYCKVYDVHLEEEVAVLSGHDHGLYSVKFSPSKANLVGTVSSDHTCRLWNAENGECMRILEGHMDEVNGLAFKNGTHLLATASDDMTGKIWDAEKGASISDLKGHRHAVYGVAFQAQGHLLATASFDLTAKLWDPRTAESIRTLKGHLEDVIGVDFDTSGNILATGSDDKTCRVWDLRTGNVLEVLEEHGGEVKRVVFSPFSRLLATTCGDTTVRLFDTRTYQCHHILSSHSDHVFDVAWSPKADFLVTASHDHFWKLWLPKSSTSVGYTSSSKYSHL